MTALGRTLFAVTCVGALAAGGYGTAVVAQGRGAREPQPRELERQSRIEIDGFGSSIGATVRDVSTEEGQRAKLSAGQGAYVTRVDPGSPAQKAGIAAGDIIVEFDGERVRSARQLSRLVRETADDRAVKSVVVRDGTRRTVDVTPDRDRAFAALPDLSRLDRQMRDFAQRFEFNWNGRNGGAWGGSAFGTRGRLGVQLMPITDQLATTFGVKNGVMITSVDMDSAAGRAGLKAGDIITSINSRSVNDVSDVLEEVRRADAGASLAITLTRDHKELKLTATMPQNDRAAGRADRRERRIRSI